MSITRINSGKNKGKYRTVLGSNQLIMKQVRPYQFQVKLIKQAVKMKPNYWKKRCGYIIVNDKI